MLENEKEATCTAEGYTGDKVCADCGKVLEKGEIVPKPAHSYKNGTCTACGASDPDYRPADPADPAASGRDKDGSTPRTDDSGNLTLWLLLLTASGCVLMGIAYSRRRKH